MKWLSDLLDRIFGRRKRRWVKISRLAVTMPERWRINVIR